MVSIIVPLQRRREASPAAAARRGNIFSLERRRREDDQAGGGGGMDLSGTTQGELPIPMPLAAAGGHVVHQKHEHHGNSNNNNNGQQHGESPLASAAEDSGKKRATDVTVAVSAGGAGSGSSEALVQVRYRECLKNHAAAMGGNATDGCGEFMPSGEEGSLEVLKCSACGCHRNFHRKELPDVIHDHGCGYGHHRRLLGPAVPPHHNKSSGGPYSPTACMRAPPPAFQFLNAMPLSAAAMQNHRSAESDEIVVDLAAMRGGGGGLGAKKRFRTKFSAEQKARMLAFAERVGWRMQKLDDAMVQSFCNEIGVRRRVLKVWMHNNKHTLASTANRLIEGPPPPPPPPMPATAMPAAMEGSPSPPNHQMRMAPQPEPSTFHLDDGPSSPPQPLQMAMPPPLKMD